MIRINKTNIWLDKHVIATIEHGYLCFNQAVSLPELIEIVEELKNRILIPDKIPLYNQLRDFTEVAAYNEGYEIGVEEGKNQEKKIDLDYFFEKLKELNI